jgi:hypothetical protein
MQRAWAGELKRSRVRDCWGKVFERAWKTLDTDWHSKGDGWHWYNH